jgi:hypothetical protein
MKIFEGLSNSKSMVCNVKKLQDDGMDLRLWQGMKKSYPSGMSSRYGGFRLPMVRFSW